VIPIPSSGVKTGDIHVRQCFVEVKDLVLHRLPASLVQGTSDDELKLNFCKNGILSKFSFSRPRSSEEVTDNPTFQAVHWPLHVGTSRFLME
jgi:hypothetical protein